MSDVRWKPSVTVAAVIEREGRFLMVEEHTAQGLRLNQPAGHLDPGESLIQAVVREVLEETACRFVPQALLGVYLARLQRPLAADQACADVARGGVATTAPAAGEDITYLRFAFVGTVGEPEPGRALDQPIVRTLWLSADELRAQPQRHRSPLLLRCLDDHAAGLRYPLETLQSHASVWLGS